MVRHWTVYAHVVPKEISNYPHDKYYIGITCQKLENRFKCGYGYDGCKLFWRAIQKYGWNNIVHLVLMEGLSEKEAKQMEQIMIAHFHSIDPEYGYNLTMGGEGITGYHHREETKKD